MSKFRTKEIKQLMLENLVGIRVDEIDPLIEAWVLGNDLNLVPTGYGRVMPEPEVVQYLMDHCLNAFNNCEDSDFGNLTFYRFPSNWDDSIHFGNTADDHIYGLKEGFMAIDTKYTLGVAQAAGVSMPFIARNYLRLSWWMKYSTEQGYNEGNQNTFRMGLGGSSLPLPPLRVILGWMGAINTGWKKYRAFISSSLFNVDRLDDGVWTRIFTGVGGADMSKDHLWFYIDDACSTTMSYSHSNQFDGLQIFGSVV
jgi:hypothetical protein